mmetsp:Transcript_24438/g.75371  ORF Transcript_24438/g.75371 Transcript_24438/m.75371 type:complete len:126 (-) Transcript_24438:22-399(-)
MATPMQEWAPAADSYDVIWVQWCVGHLTDSHFVRFLHRCKAALSDAGVLVIKDNCLADTVGASDESFVVDDDDRSVCRNRPYFEALFALAGATVTLSAKQTTAAGAAEAFPPDIYPVRSWALRFL